MTGGVTRDLKLAEKHKYKTKGELGSSLLLSDTPSPAELSAFQATLDVYVNL